MKRLIIYFVGQSTLAALLYFGLFRGVEWAENLAGFWIISLFILVIFTVVCAAAILTADNVELPASMRNKRPSLGDEGYVIASFFMSAFIAAGGAPWWALIYFVSCLLNLFWMAISRDVEQSS